MLINKKKVISVVVAGLILVVGQAVYANTKDPGSNEDPLVTLSLVEMKITELKGYIDQKLSGSSSGSGSTFKTLDKISAGKTLIGGEGTEIILRSGKALSIEGKLGGVSDVTGAKDLRQNENVPLNHLLIIPRNDGRGIKATTDIYVMVKGSYEIK